MNNKLRSDQNFDEIANKFERNIYGTTKGRLRHAVLLHHLTEQLDLNTRCLDILDAGGGTGVMTKAMLELGHNVTLTDVSEQSLAIAQQKFRQFDRVALVHADIQSFPQQRQYDLVICHAVLEWLAEPMAIFPKLVELVAPGGYLSVSFFNLDAFRFGNLLYGNFDYVQQGMQTSNQVRLNPQCPLSPREVIEAFSELAVSIKYKAGVRCFHDYLKNTDARESQYEQLKAMEIEYGCQEPYLWLGKYFHMILQRD